MTEAWIPDDEWRTIVANVPIVSIDLLIRTDDGLVFGKRTNEPAKGYWFPSGGRVRKFEAREECGLEAEIVESFGAFEPCTRRLPSMASMGSTIWRTATSSISRGVNSNRTANTSRFDHSAPHRSRYTRTCGPI
jgi:hypothetical protein